jgi:hypothetical protein
MKRIAILLFVCLGWVSVSASAGSLKSQLAECAQVQDKLARLICFDNLAQVAKDSISAKKQSVSSTPTVVKVPVVSKEESFGAEYLKKPETAEDDLQVTFVVEKINKDQYGNWRFTFKNGQRWKQTDSVGFSVKEGDSVILKKGFLGVVYLKKNKSDSNKKIRVKRIK